MLKEFQYQLSTLLLHNHNDQQIGTLLANRQQLVAAP
jgi:hypothetical protein